MNDQSIEVTDETYDQIVKSKHLVIVVVCMEGCPPCGVLHEALEKKIIPLFAGKEILFALLDLHKCIAIADKLNLDSAPRIFIWRDGVGMKFDFDGDKEIEYISGWAKSLTPKLVKLIQSLL